MSYELYFKLNYWFDVMCIVSVKGKVNSLFIAWGNQFLNHKFHLITIQFLLRVLCIKDFD